MNCPTCGAAFVPTNVPNWFTRPCTCAPARWQTAGPAACASDVQGKVLVRLRGLSIHLPLHEAIVLANDLQQAIAEAARRSNKWPFDVHDRTFAARG